jgi:redox-sensitive bicupin YhaK (pirin superfamily)
VPVTTVEVHLQPDARIERAVPAGHNAFVVVLEGSARIVRFSKAESEVCSAIDR